MNIDSLIFVRRRRVAIRTFMRRWMQRAARRWASESTFIEISPWRDMVRGGGWDGVWECVFLQI